MSIVTCFSALVDRDGKLLGWRFGGVPEGDVYREMLEWDMVSGIFSGAALDTQMVTWCRRVTRGDVTTVLAGPQVILKATFTIGPPNRLREIDYLNLAGPNKSKAQAGIFELTHDTLQICMAAPASQRNDSRQ